MCINPQLKIVPNKCTIYLSLCKFFFAKNSSCLKKRPRLLFRTEFPLHLWIFVWNILSRSSRNLGDQCHRKTVDDKHELNVFSFTQPPSFLMFTRTTMKPFEEELSVLIIWLAPSLMAGVSPLRAWPLHSYKHLWRNDESYKLVCFKHTTALKHYWLWSSYGMSFLPKFYFGYRL